VTVCHLCKNLCVYEVEPACDSHPAVTEPDIWRVAARNNLTLEVCLSCWMLWPDEHKSFPAEAFGLPLLHDLRVLSTVRLVDVLKDVA
jgi:hypothetical protein